MIQVTLYWWYLPLVLSFVPIIYARIYKDQTEDTPFFMFLLAVCWGTAPGILLGYFMCLYGKG